MKQKKNYVEKTREEMEAELKALSEMLEQGIEQAGNSDFYKKLLDTASKFHNYSLSNTLLILMQNPDATYVAGYKTWGHLGRHIKRGEKSIRIYAPAFKTVTINVEKVDRKTGERVTEKEERVIQRFKAISVFDVSQTDGDEIPGITDTELKGKADDYDALLLALMSVTTADVEFGEVAGLSKGYYRPSDNTIMVKEGMSEIQTVKTLAHEVGHSLMHCGECAVPREQMELEAESVAYIVCSHFGLDVSDYSFTYIAGWARENGTEKLRESIKTIHATAGAIITGMESLLCMENDNAMEGVSA